MKNWEIAKHKNLGWVLIDDACHYMQETNPDSSSIFVVHDREMLEVSRNMIEQKRKISCAIDEKDLEWALEQIKEYERENKEC